MLKVSQMLLTLVLKILVENPFGYDANDLDLDQFCEDVRKEIVWIKREVPAGGSKIPDKDWTEDVKRYVA